MDSLRLPTHKPKLPTSIPPEIQEDILDIVWGSSLTLDERTTLMASSVLVSKSWTVIYSRVSSKDVFIPCPKYVPYFIKLLDGQCNIFNHAIHHLPQEHCRSLSFRVEMRQHRIFPEHEDPWNASSIFDLLYCLHRIPSYLPNLRRISIEYSGGGYSDLCNGFRLLNFPSQVTDLQISFVYDLPPLPHPTETSTTLMKHVTCYMPSLRRLTILGDGLSWLILQMLGVSPNVHTLEMDLGNSGVWRTERMSTVTSVILRCPQTSDDEGRVLASLRDTLSNPLFPPKASDWATKCHIVVGPLKVDLLGCPKFYHLRDELAQQGASLEIIQEKSTSAT